MQFKFEPSEVAVCVITYYPRWYKGQLRTIKHRDKVRGELAIEFLKKATKAGYQVVVADGKSVKTFRRTISQLHGLTLIKRHSLKRSVAKRQVVKKASILVGVKAIIITEPEKISILDSIDKITKPILEEQVDIVVPKRAPELFQKTYPSYMYESETEGNKLYNEILRTHNILKTGEDIDIFFGPCAFANKPKIVSLFTRPYHIKIAKSAYLSDYFFKDPISIPIYFGVIMSLKKNLRVNSVEIPFKYPSIQKENEEKDSKELFLEKRKNQKMAIVIELLHFLNHLVKKMF